MKIFQLIKTLLLWGCLLTPQWSAASDLVLVQGELRTFEIKKNETVWVDGSRYLDVNDLGTKIQILAKKRGTTTLRVGTKYFKVHILSQIRARIYFELSKLFKSIRGLSVTPQLNISGKLMRIEDFRSIQSVLSSYPDISITSQINIHPLIKKEFHAYLNQICRNENLPLVHVRSMNPLSISIPSKNKSLASRYKNLFKFYGIKVISDSSLNPVNPTVRVKLTIAEIQKSKFQQFGIDWVDSHPAKYFASGKIKTSGQFDLTIKALIQNGLGRILAQPNLISENGKKAHFFAGGEIPLRVSHHKNSRVDWKSYGISLEFLPRVDMSETISLDISTKTSYIDPSTTIDGIPGFTKNEVNSHFTLKNKNTIALSGLVKSHSGSSKQGIPGLSQIPILGSLFSSQQFLDQKSELVIFVTPEIIPLEKNEPESQIGSEEYDI